MFRVLVVDDDPLALHLLREMMKNLRRPHELHVAKDGREALDFLRRRRGYLDAPRPDLILLDMNMPRLNGLETLSAIKGDAELCTIPVIILSTSDSSNEVRRSYRAHANAYVQKPTELNRFVKLIQAIESFWIDFAIRPDCNVQPQPHTGQTIAQTKAEVFSPAIHSDDFTVKKIATPLHHSDCEEHNRLLEKFGATVQELVKLHEQQFLAIVEGDTECNRFDLLIHMASEEKQLAKYAYMRHVESHGCLNTNGVKQTRP